MTVLPSVTEQAPRETAGVYHVGLLNRFYEGVLWRRRNATGRAFVLKTFRDGEALYDAYRANEPVQQVTLRDGRSLVHPERAGLIATLIELWHHRGYTQGLYRPRAGDTVIDAGANVGLFSTYILRACPNVRVLAIEPAEENLAALKQNIETFGGDAKNITAAAIGAAPGEAEFLLAPCSLDHCILEHSPNVVAENIPGAKFVRVPVVTLDDVMHRAGVDRVALLKLDIECAEYALLDGVSDALLKRFDRIAIEPHPELSGRPADDLIRRLEGLFDVRWYGPLIQARRR